MNNCPRAGNGARRPANSPAIAGGDFQRQPLSIGYSVRRSKLIRPPSSALRPPSFRALAKRGPTDASALGYCLLAIPPLGRQAAGGDFQRLEARRPCVKRVDGGMPAGRFRSTFALHKGAAPVRARRFVRSYAPSLKENTLQRGLDSGDVDHPRSRNAMLLGLTSSRYTP